MHIKVVRSVFTQTATLGEMLIDDVHFAFTLEDTDRHLNGDCSKKVQNNTAIDAGTYSVTVSMSGHFGKELPEVLNVPCFAGIRIHGGNTDKDTEGCILIGAESNHHDTISNCAERVATITHLIKSAPGGNATLEIVRI